LQKNTEVVRRIIEERAITGLWDSDCDYYPTRKFPDAVPRHGPEECSRFMIQFRETWARFENPIKRLVPISDDRVLAATTIRAEGPGSRVKVEGDLYYCVWLRHGQVFRWEDHLTLKGALHALGLHGETLQAAGLEE
jgi:hypothetical protein